MTSHVPPEGSLLTPGNVNTWPFNLRDPLRYFSLANGSSQGQNLALTVLNVPTSRQQTRSLSGTHFQARVKLSSKKKKRVISPQVFLLMTSRVQNVPSDVPWTHLSCGPKFPRHTQLITRPPTGHGASFFENIDGCSWPESWLAAQPPPLPPSLGGTSVANKLPGGASRQSSRGKRAARRQCWSDASWGAQMQIVSCVFCGEAGVRNRRPARRASLVGKTIQARHLCVLQERAALSPLSRGSIL